MTTAAAAPHLQAHQCQEVHVGHALELRVQVDRHKAERVVLAGHQLVADERARGAAPANKLEHHQEAGGLCTQHEHAQVRGSSLLTKALASRRMQPGWLRRKHEEHTEGMMHSMST